MAAAKSAGNNSNASFSSSASKQSAAAMPEGGTSVAPRMRPKAREAGLGTATTTLPIMLPPSPSPRTVVSSPVPVVQAQQQLPSIPMGPPATPQQQPQAVALDSHQGDDFNAQFTAVFPPTQVTAVGHTTNIESKLGSVGSEKHLNNLFETKFPDPFREQHESVGGGRGSVGGGGGGGGSGAGTPTKGPVNSLAAGHHHRRNVSDTSAFNK